MHCNVTIVLQLYFHFHYVTMRCWELKSYKGIFVLETVKSKEVVPHYGTLNKHNVLAYCFGVYNLHYLAASFLVFIANWGRGMSDGIVFTWLHSVWILKDQGWKKQWERFFTSSKTRKTVKELWFQFFFLWRVSSSDQASLCLHRVIILYSWS